jgi:transcriptional regulator with XRE-family HTH domain
MTSQLTAINQTAFTELGQRLAHHRLNQNLTQQELAREAGVGVNTVYRIEQGRSTQLSNLLRIMRVLGLARNFDQLVPAFPLSPIEQLKLNKEQRKRAFARKEKARRPGGWKWGDES